MNGPAPDPKAWSRLKLFTMALIAAAVQAGLIYWASDRKPFHPRTTIERPSVQLAALAHNELLALNDPTIFSRAHVEGFSGPAWLTVRVQPSDIDTNTAPQQQWLALATTQLGDTFRGYVLPEDPQTLSISLHSQPTLMRSGTAATLTMATVSSVELKDALKTRELVNFPPLPSQTNADILLPSEVQVLVDARGNPISAALLKSSGIKSADLLAVAIARNAQFTPARDVSPRDFDNPNKGVIPGRMIFHWYTIPAPASSNGAAVNPQ